MSNIVSMLKSQQRRKKWHIFYPDGRFRLLWDVAHSVTLLITCILTPFNLAFSEQVSQVEVYTQLNLAIDLFFLVDIFVNLNTALVDEKFNIIDDRCPIFCTYLKSWLLIDILSILPLEIVIEFFQHYEPDHDHGNAMDDPSAQNVN